MPKWNAVIIYRAKEGKSLLTVDNVNKMRRIEQRVQRLENWKHLCLAASTKDAACSKDAFVTPLAVIPQSSTDESLRKSFMKDAQKMF